MIRTRPLEYLHTRARQAYQSIKHMNALVIHTKSTEISRWCMGAMMFTGMHHPPVRWFAFIAATVCKKNGLYS